MDSGRTFGWSIKGKNSADVVKADEFRLNFFEGAQKENIHETTTESILGRC